MTRRLAWLSRLLACRRASGGYLPGISVGPRGLPGRSSRAESRSLSWCNSGKNSRPSRHFRVSYTPYPPLNQGSSIGHRGFFHGGGRKKFSVFPVKLVQSLFSSECNSRNYLGVNEVLILHLAQDLVHVLFGFPLRAMGRLWSSQLPHSFGGCSGDGVIEVRDELEGVLHDAHQSLGSPCPL
jgi:hypothetical protein